MKIVVIGAGAAGLLAAGKAAETADEVVIIEKNDIIGKKLLITGKGRCNITNSADIEDMIGQYPRNAKFLYSALYTFTNDDIIRIIEENGVKTKVERGSRVFPVSDKSQDVVKALKKYALKPNVSLVHDTVKSLIIGDGTVKGVKTSKTSITADRVIICTGGKSYPRTGSTGDGYTFAKSLGHSIKQCFPSLTALVPKEYKLPLEENSPELKGHVDRSAALSETGTALCGNSLKNIGIRLFVNGSEVQEMEGDIDFTDGGLEGPAGFAISRNAVKAILNGSKVKVALDLKSGVPAEEFEKRVAELWKEVGTDPRSKGKSVRQMAKVLLGKLMPWEIIPGFMKCHPEIISGSKGKETLKMRALVNTIRNWEFDIAGYVGYERCVITAGGVSCDEIVPKTLSSRKCPGLYLCGEVLDIDADTGGHNLQIAFSTGYLAGRSAALSL